MNFLKNNPKKIRKEDGGKQIKKERRGKRKKVPSHFRLSESNHLKWLSTNPIPLPFSDQLVISVFSPIGRMFAFTGPHHIHVNIKETP